MDVFHSDIGAVCSCEGTIYRYSLRKVASVGVQVDTYCFGCHKPGDFQVSYVPESAAQCSSEHRAVQGGISESGAGVSSLALERNPLQALGI
jgi:hypothetical protein